MEDFENFLDADYKDRVEVLNATDNWQQIRGFIGKPLTANYKDGVFESEHPQMNTPQIEITDKYAIIFTEKGGSSAIIGILDQYKLSNLKVSNNDNHPRLIATLMFNTSELEEFELSSEQKEIKDILDGNSKKDLIIVTRNPIYKWLSGVYQDVLFEVERSSILLNQVLDKNKSFKPYNFSENNKKKLLAKESLSQFVYSLLKYRQRIGIPIASDHSRLYNETFFSMLLNLKIDKSKLKIIDLDDPGSDLMDCLSKYNPEILETCNTESYWTQRPHHTEIISSINTECKKRNDEELLSKIKDELLKDFYYYTLIRKHYKDYIYKN